MHRHGRERALGAIAEVSTSAGAIGTRADGVLATAGVVHAESSQLREIAKSPVAKVA